MTRRRRVFYDCEFLEDGRTIEMLSIGMVDDQGREMYAVNADAPLRRKWWAPWRKTRVERHPWLMENVVPHLARPHGDWILHMPRGWLVDYCNPNVVSRAAIAARVQDFITCDPDTGERGPDVELWAWYGAYDHVALAQLFGPMVKLPRGIPMYTNDLRQEVQRLGNPRLPDQPDGLHNALADARHVKARFEYVASLPGGEWLR